MDVLFLCCIFPLLLSAIKADIGLSLEFDKDTGPGYKVYVGDKEWLRSGIFKIRHEGEWWSSESPDKYSLQPTDNSEERGTDSIGDFFKRK
jgi:hypothetical protein